MTDSGLGHHIQWQSYDQGMQCRLKAVPEKIRMEKIRVGGTVRCGEGYSTLHSQSRMIEFDNKLAPAAFEDLTVDLPTQCHTLMRMPVCNIFVSIVQLASHQSSVLKGRSAL